MIETQVDGIEERLQRSLRNSEVLQLLTHQKSLTHFTTALKLNAMLLKQLQNEPLVHLQIEQALLEHVLVEMRQALEMTQIAGDILSQMIDAFASIISNNLNVVMKFLTAFTIVLTFPTMVASFYCVAAAFNRGCCFLLAQRLVVKRNVVLQYRFANASNAALE